MTQPLVSVFLPTHAKLKSGSLQRAVESVLAQQYRNFEFLIVDDASSDGTAQYVQTLAASDSRVKHIRFQRNVGLPAQTLAQAFLQSNGQFLAFIFDDSLWHPHHLTKLVGALQAQPDLAMAYAQTLMHRPGGQESLGRVTTATDLLKGNCIGNPAVMLPRWIVDKVGWYDPHIVMKRSCDWDLWVRILSRHRAAFIPEIVAEEFGEVLSDSLGRSNLLFLPLLERYRTIPRDHLLSPEHIVSGDYSLSDVALELTAQEKFQLHILVLQHYIKSANLEKLSDYTRDLIRQNLAGMDLLCGKFGISRQDIEQDPAKLVYLGTAFYLNYRMAENDSQCLEFDRRAAASSVLNVHNRIQQLERAYWSLDDRYHQLQRSRSWTVTKPLRDFHKIAGSVRRSAKSAVILKHSMAPQGSEIIITAIRRLMAGETLEQVAADTSLTPEVLDIWRNVFVEAGLEAVHAHHFTEHGHSRPRT